MITREQAEGVGLDGAHRFAGENSDFHLPKLAHELGKPQVHPHERRSASVLAATAVVVRVVPEVGAEDDGKVAGC